MNRLDWNLERYRTRDRLIEYNINIYPIVPHSAGLVSIYPWENITLTNLSNQLFTLAKNHGYNGTEKEFLNKFSNSSIVYSTLSDFPALGNEHTLYLDTETDILYYFKTTSAILDPDLIAIVGIAVVGTSRVARSDETVTHLYIPIKAMPIEKYII